MIKSYLTVTIDTESDHLPSDVWQKKEPVEFRSVTEGIGKNLIPVFREFGVRPVYLLTDEVMLNDECADLLKTQIPVSELGTHFHYENINELAFGRGEEKEFKNLKNITDLYKEKFGNSPVSYRAGRFGVTRESIKSLKKLGYKIDTSITPYVSWKNVSDKMDYSCAPDQPYFIDEDSILSKSDSGILEIPVSIAPRILRSGAWFRPTFSDAGRVRNIVNFYEKKYTGRDFIVYNMMFHSMEICEGTSPFTATRRGFNLILDRLKRIFEYTDSKKMTYQTLSEIGKLYKI